MRKLAAIGLLAVGQSVMAKKTYFANNSFARPKKHREITFFFVFATAILQPALGDGTGGHGHGHGGNGNGNGNGNGRRNGGFNGGFNGGGSSGGYGGPGNGNGGGGGGGGLFSNGYQVCMHWGN